MSKQFSVLCGVGAQGGAVVHALLARGARVRVLGRDSAKVRKMFGDRVSFAAADLDQPQSVAAALAGSAGVFAMLPIPPGFTVAQSRAGGLLHALATAKPERVVYSTGGFAVPALGAAGYVQGNMAMAAGIRGLPVPSLVLRPAIYVDNLMWTELTARLRGEGVLSYPPLPGDRRLSWTSHAEQGEAAAVALTTATFPTGEFDIALHGAPTQTQLADHLSRCLGRSVVHQPASPEDFGMALGQTLGSAEIGAGIANMYATIAAAAPDAAVVDPKPLERALGLVFGTLDGWLARHFR